MDKLVTTANFVREFCLISHHWRGCFRPTDVLWRSTCGSRI